MEMMTIMALKLTPARWETVDKHEQQKLVRRQLWVKANMTAYQEQMKQEYLEQLKSDKPHQYNIMMKYLRKNQ